MQHPDRNFATIACRGGSAAEVLCGLEYGSACALLTADAAGRALCVETREGLRDVRRTLRLAEGGIQAASLRSWLSERKGASPRALSVVVNSGAGPYLCRPLQMGADVVVEDLRDLLGPTFAGCAAVCARTDAVLARFLGEAGIDAPQCGDTFPVERELEAALPLLGMVSQARSDRAMVVANYLAVHPEVAWVSYPGLPGDPANDLARRSLEHGFGWTVAFGVGATARFDAEFPLPARFGTSRVDVPQAGLAVLSAGLEEPLDIVGFLERSLHADRVEDVSS